MQNPARSVLLRTLFEGLNQVTLIKFASYTKFQLPKTTIEHQQIIIYNWLLIYYSWLKPINKSGNRIAKNA